MTRAARFPYAALLQRKCACGSNAGTSGSCNDCDKKRLQRRAAASQQAWQRQADGESRYEAEADRVAEQVLAVPHAVSAAVAPGRFAAPHIQRRGTDPGAALMDVPPQVDSALARPGRPLDATARQFFEPRFGHDFSRVRVHVDNAAAEAVQAQAFTVGHHIVFAAHQYAPSNTAGLRLLAHELTHVVQQGASDGAASAISGMPLSRQAASALQRKPQPPYPGKVLSLSEIAKDPVREKLRDNTKQTEAKVCRSIGRASDKDNCPTRLAEGDKVTVTAEKAAGLWLQIENKGIPNFGPSEPCNVLGAFIEAQEAPPAAKPKAETQETIPPGGAAAQRNGAELVSQKYGDVKADPQYLDNFSNDINDAWLPNDRAFVFQYPNGSVLKIALQDLLRALDVKSDLNPPPKISENLKRSLDAAEASGDLVLPRVKGDEPEGTYVFRELEQATAFYRDPGSKVIYPKRSKIPRTFLPRISHALDQIEPARVDQELWQRAAPKLVEIVANMEWSAPQGFGSLLVSLGRRLRRAGGAVKGLLRPGVPKVSAPHAEVPVPHVSAPRAAEQEIAESVPHAAPSKPPGAAAKATSTAVDEVTEETKDLFRRRPDLKDALEANPRAASILKHCNSPCFPEYATTHQIERIEEALAKAEREGFPIDRKKAMEYFRSIDKRVDLTTAAERAAELERRIAKFNSVREDLAAKQAGASAAPDAAKLDAERAGPHGRTYEYDPSIGDSTRLGENLTAAARKKPGGSYQAHHIIPSNEGPQELRDLFGKHRLDINGEYNGVWLPTARDKPNLGAEMKHEFVTGSKEYFERLQALLITKPPLTKLQFVDRLRVIAGHLQSGKLPPANLFQ